MDEAQRALRLAIVRELQAILESDDEDSGLIVMLDIDPVRDLLTFFQLNFSLSGAALARVEAVADEAGQGWKDEPQADAAAAEPVFAGIDPVVSFHSTGGPAEIYFRADVSGAPEMPFAFRVTGPDVDFVVQAVGRPGENHADVGRDLPPGDYEVEYLGSADVRG